jgi:hypothetical protein
MPDPPPFALDEVAKAPGNRTEPSPANWPEEPSARGTRTDSCAKSVPVISGRMCRPSRRLKL